MIKTEVKDNVNRYLECKNLKDFIFHQGYYHFIDRGMQMELLRIISSGRISECLQDSEETLEIDKFMRELGIYHYSKIEAEKASNSTQQFLENYCSGVNKAIKEHRPFEFKLVSHQIEDFKPHDIIATIKIMSYMGLAQGQQDLEKIILSLINGGCDLEKVKAYFNIPTDAINETKSSLIKQLRIKNSPFSKKTKFLQLLPKIQASNNWISNKNGHVLMACDPHLEVNRLPCIWYEMSAKIDNKSFFGITMPGVPGFIMGKTSFLTYSFTYGFMDQIDYFIEEIRDNKVREDSQFSKLNVRKEAIKRKKHLDYDIFIKETNNGVLESDSKEKLIEDGFYLSTAWSVQKDGCLNTLDALKNILHSKTTKEAMNVLRNVCISCNWLIGDINGDIAYQQSGLLPKRTQHGLTPGLGWKTDNQWQGFIGNEQLRSTYNPESKFLVTANHDIEYGENTTGVESINSPMSAYRRDFIADQLLQEEHTLDNFKKIQKGFISEQAKHYLNKYNHLKSHKYFENWNCSYDTDSRVAPLFETFYAHLIDQFLSDHFIDKESAKDLREQTSFMADFYDFFDSLFLKEKDSIFFANKSREDYIKAALDSTNENDTRWGDINKINMNNIFFDGKLPSFFGFDRSNIEIPGNRATVSQGAVYKAHGRTTSFCPSWRFVVSLESNECQAHLPGGLSDRRFSKNYQSDISNWENFHYRHYQLEN